MVKLSKQWTTNRLVVIGAKPQVEKFQGSSWERTMGTQHTELLENSPARFACQFYTKAAPFESLRELSRRWPQLAFLLDYETDGSRTKGLAKARAGQLQHYKIKY